MVHSSWRLVVSMMVILFPVATTALCQSQEDRKTLEKARSAYLLKPMPASIACGVELDWDGAFKKMKIDMTAEVTARLEKLKNVKISVTSQSPNQTDVKVDAVGGSSSLSDGIRQQLQGFFQMYWSESYGKMLAAKPNDSFEWTKLPEGYRMKSTTSSMTVETTMDKTYLVTSTTVASPQMNAVMTPVFKPGPDGLFRLGSLDESIELGATKMVIHVGLDYQKAGIYEVPQHVTIALPGSYSFDYTLIGCVAKGAIDAPPATDK